MSVLAYRDPVRMALRLEIKALQKQVKQLEDLLDEANTYIPADRSVVVFIYFSFILGNVSWAVAALLMGFAAVAAFSIGLHLK